MHDIHELGELLPYSKTKVQRQIVQALINNQGCEKTTLKYLGDTFHIPKEIRKTLMTTVRG